MNYNANAGGRRGVVKDVEAAGRRAVALKGDMGEGSGHRARLRRDGEGARPGDAFRAFLRHHRAASRASTRRATETIRAALDVNTLGALLCLRAAIRRMSTKHGGKGGAIVMLSSMAATIGGASECIWYAASKGAVDTMVIGAAREVAQARASASTPSRRA